MRLHQTTHPSSPVWNTLCSPYRKLLPRPLWFLSSHMILWSTRAHMWSNSPEYQEKWAQIQTSLFNEKFKRFQVKIIRNVHNVEDRRRANTEEVVANCFKLTPARRYKIRNTSWTNSSELNPSVINHLLNWTYQYPFAHRIRKSDCTSQMHYKNNHETQINP